MNQPPPNPRYEHAFSVPEWRDLSDPAEWGTPGAVFMPADAGHDFGPPPPKRKVHGEELFSTGTGALLVLGLVWLASEAANRKLR